MRRRACCCSPSCPPISPYISLISPLYLPISPYISQARLLLLALVGGEHLLLLGPPGTAKSELCRRLSRLSGLSYFERTLTRFSTPEELFGPLSLAALERDEYRRATAGYAPEAELLFIDEVFKSNSAILNTLLTLLNERLFDDGATRGAVPRPRPNPKPKPQPQAQPQP